jgi:hypothetical protein
VADEQAPPGGLGRVYIPDARDWKLEDFLEEGVTDPLQTALNRMLNDKNAAASVKNWAKLAQVRLLTIPAPPTPSPQPTPSGDVQWVDKQPVLDQGQQGTCVGHGWAQWGNTEPIDDTFTHNDALDIYYQATINDGSPDDPRAPGGGQQGASVRGGAKAMQQKGRLNNYAFTYTVDTLRKWVQTQGPAVMGTNWLQNMFNPGADGVLNVSGSVVGGHCWGIIGDLMSEDHAWCLNSWGAAWALKGYFKVKWEDIATLLSQQGEACTAIEIPH